MLKSMLALFFVLITVSLSFAQEDHATVSLQRWKDKIVVSIAHENGWHTYWKNPGDAGLPTAFKFMQNSSPTELSAFEWPTPTKYIEEGDILTIGYGGTKHFFFSAPKGDLSAHVTFLICKDICIPGEAKLNLPGSSDFASNRRAQSYSAKDLQESFEDLPQLIETPSNLEYYLTREKDQNSLTLHYSLKNLSSKKLPHKLGLLTAFPHPPFGFKREKLFQDENTIYGKMEIDWDGEYLEPPQTLPQDGSFKEAKDLVFLFNSPSTGKVEKVKLSLKNFTLSTPTLDNFYKDLKPFDSEKPSALTPKTEGEKNILQYLFFAFLGGLILNLMPCVLPVISLKLFGLIKHRNETRQRLLAHNISYTAGVLSTFLGLALVVAGLKAGGEEIGWGFQLQSPAFILIMMLILFILSLNLFGLYEFYTPGGSKLGGAQTPEGLSGDFFSGVLTTILATPCSAPFLGTALTFAFTTSNFTIFLMFFMIGLGLAFPFLLTAIFPQSLALFPRPGAWMEKLKYFLGLSLLGTAIWLYDVFVSLVNFELLSWRLNLLFALWFFAFFFAQKISQRKILQFLVFALPLVLTVVAIQNLELKPLTESSRKTSGAWENWSEESMMAEKDAPVFVDFTAEWCLTCKVNKKLVLETSGFEELKEKYGIKTMRADWTRRDDRITEFLKRHGSVGVPAYFIQRNGKIIPLGETISLSEIEAELK